MTSKANARLRETIQSIANSVVEASRGPFVHEFTLTFDAESDPVFPPLPDAGEDGDLTNYNDPHVYRVEAYVRDDGMGGTARRKPVRSHDPRDIEVTDVYRIDAGGSETLVPWRHWQDGEEGIIEAIVADLEHQYDGWDGGA